MLQHRAGTSKTATVHARSSECVVLGQGADFGGVRRNWRLEEEPGARGGAGQGAARSTQALNA
jgi:hypothetical protein